MGLGGDQGETFAGFGVPSTGPKSKGGKGGGYPGEEG